MLLDAPILLFGDASLVATGLWGMWPAGLVNLQQASDALLGLACFSMFALLVKAYVGQGRPRELPSRGNVGTLGAFLIVSGL
jgi:hypothetical protein